MKRVLLGHFGNIVRLGLDDLLRGEGCELVAEETTGEALVDRLLKALPDVVVLDLDDEQGPETAQAISAAFPSVKVVAFSADGLTMRVFPPFHRGESYAMALSTQGLLETVSST